MNLEQIEARHKQVMDYVQQHTEGTITVDQFVDYTEQTEILVTEDIPNLIAKVRGLEEELKERPALPLEGEGRSRLLAVMEVGTIDRAIRKYKAMLTEIASIHGEDK